MTVMKNKFFTTWTTGVFVITLWYIITTNIVLIPHGRESFWYGLLIVFIIAAWVKVRKIEKLLSTNMALGQQKKIAFFIMSLFWLLSILELTVTLTTPNNPTVRGQFFWFEQLNTFGLFGLTLYFSYLDIRSYKALSV